MPTSPGYADVGLEIVHGSMARSSWVTFGVDPTDTDPALVAANIITAMTGTGSLQGVVDSTATFRRVRVSLGQDGAEDVIADVAISLPGLTSTTTVPPNVAVLVHKRTARGGRRGRGRMYIPWGVGATQVDEAGVITGSVVTTIQGKMSAFLSALTTNNVPMVILHNTGISTMGPPNLVTSMVVDTRVGTQRRRLGR